MPRYKKDINQILEKPDFELLLTKAANLRDRALLAFLYLTGARPTEIVEVKKKDVYENTADPDAVYIRVKTAKLGKKAIREFTITERILVFPKTTAYLNLVADYAATLPTPDNLLFPFSPTRIRQLVYQMSENKYCPYHFRHSRLTKLSRAGATTDELMYWKGALEIKSVSAYLKAKPIGRKLTIE
jgi:integrase